MHVDIDLTIPSPCFLNSCSYVLQGLLSRQHRNFWTQKLKTCFKTDHDLISTRCLKMHKCFNIFTCKQIDSIHWLIQTSKKHLCTEPSFCHSIWSIPSTPMSLNLQNIFWHSFQTNGKLTKCLNSLLAC